jgi:signal transduction histidine kinase
MSASPSLRQRQHSVRRCFSHLIVLCFTAAIACAPSHSGKAPPVAVKGVLDLRHWDFEKDGPLEIKGESEFYWKQLMSPADFAPPAQGGAVGADYIRFPGEWNKYSVRGEPVGGDGYATYRFRLLLPGEHPQLLLRMEDQGSAYVLFWNGQKISSAGRVSASAETESPEYVRRYLSPPMADSVDVVVQISNHFHRRGGFWQAMRLGTADQIQGARDHERLTDGFLAGALLIMGLYHLGLFFYRRKDHGALWFGLLCLIVTARVLLTGAKLGAGFFPSIPLFALLKLEYLSLYGSITPFAIFLRMLFPAEFSRAVARAIAGISLLVCAAVIFLPARLYTHTLPGFQILVLVSGIYAIVALVRVNLARRDGALTILTGTIVFFGTAVNDILYTQFLIGPGLLFPAGLFFFTFAQAAALSGRIARAFNTSEELSTSLELRVEERTRELQHARDESELARRSADEARQESEQLAAFSRRMNEAADLDVITANVLAHLRSAFGLEDLVLQLVDKERQQLFTSAQGNSSRSLTAAQVSFIRELRVPLHESSGTLFRTYTRQKPFYLPPRPENPHYLRQSEAASRTISDLDRRIAATLELQSLAQFPLIVRKETIGILWCSSGQKKLSAREIESIWRFCDQIAGVIRTNELLRETAAARAETELLANLARSANEGSSLNDVLLAVHSAVIQRMGQSAVALYMKDPADSRLDLKSLLVDGQVVSAPAVPVDLRTIHLNKSATIVRTVRKKRPVQLPGIASWPGAGGFDTAFDSLWPFTWMLQMPLVLEDRVIGVLALANRSTKRPRRADRDFLMRVTDQIAGIARTSEKLAEKEKMATIGDMAAGIVHDLKNPVGIIKGSVEVADDESTSRSERRELLQIIDQEADRMLSLVQDLLEFSRGSISIEKQNVDSGAYLERVQAVITPVFAARKIPVTTQSNYAGSLSVDPDRFLRVLVNIAGNAADALQSGGAFSLAVSRHNSHVQFKLSDNGPGIPESIRDTLFQPFVTHGKANGTGLGMAIAKSMVEAHGGTISFETETGKGTTFTIEVPA